MAKFKRRVRWVSYTMQNIPGNILSDVNFHYSLTDALEAYVDYCRAVGTDECSMSLYGLPEDADARVEMIEQAEDFEPYGCPFDYPSKIIERGPRGGVKLINA